MVGQFKIVNAWYREWFPAKSYREKYEHFSIFREIVAYFVLFFTKFCIVSASFAKFIFAKKLAKQERKLNFAFNRENFHLLASIWNVEYAQIDFLQKTFYKKKHFYQRYEDNVRDSKICKIFDTFGFESIFLKLYHKPEQ